MPTDAPQPDRLSDGVHVFVYPPGMLETNRRTSRNRRIGCWPIVCVPMVAGGIWIGRSGGQNAWLGLGVAVFFVLLAVVFERFFERHDKKTAELSAGYLTFDGQLLRQFDASGGCIAAIDTANPYRHRGWHVAGNYVVEIVQNEQKLMYTSDIEQSKRISAHILKIGDPGDSGSLG